MFLELSQAGAGLPSWFTHSITFSLGLIVGSFTNVLVARLPYDESVVHPRSRCPSCEKPIAWYDNIPVLSWVILRGKCRNCSQGISVRYPLIELLTAVLFLAAECRYGFSAALLIRDFPFLMALVAITFIDLEHRIIPDVLSLGGVFWGLVTSPLAQELSWQLSFIGAAIGFSAFFALAWVYQKWAGRSGLGGGDIKLLAMLGAYLGPMGVLTTIMISSMSGSVIGIGLGIAQKYTRKPPLPAEVPAPAAESAAASEATSESAPGSAGAATDSVGASETDIMSLAIPYGPFLVLGALYYYLLGDTLWLRFMNPT